MNILEIKDLHVKVENKEILNGIKLEIPKGETSVIFGPNGSGKTTLLMSILGIPGYEVTNGRIIFDGKDITSSDVNERSKLGLSLGFQQPPEITGVKLRDMLKICMGKKPDDDLSEEELKLVEKFKLTEFLDRDVNLGFSGGEKKRAETLQLLFMRSKLMLLDEPDSGVDIESLRLISKEIQDYISRTKSSALIITHHGQILEDIKAEKGCVLLDGKIACHGNPEEMLKNIIEKGYRACVECRKRIK